MKRTKVVVPWSEGLHLRPAAVLVRTARTFRSRIFLKSGSRMADLHSILSVLSLCATMGMSLDIEAVGDDEHVAVQAVEKVFSSGHPDGRPPVQSPGFVEHNPDQGDFSALGRDRREHPPDE